MGGCRALPWVAAALCVASASSAAPPPGQSALLNGMHDVQSLSWMLGATEGCDKGWITDLQYIGSSGSASGSCHDAATSQGISIIQRLDVDGSHSFPTDGGQVAGYAGAFASFVTGCDSIHVWVVGNEPNFTVNASDPDCSSLAYAAAYVAVHQAVHAVPGHGADLVLVAPNSPYSPGCLHSLRTIISAIQTQGVTPDGFALHAYTRAPNAGALSASYVTDGSTQNDTTIDECAGGATWNDTWRSHFRIYQDYIGVIEAAGLTGTPVFITESGNACDPNPGNDCYPDADLGYFQALYAEAAQHNATAQTLIRAITPYRWTGLDDGTGRDFEIGARPQLLADLQTAFAAKPSWTDVDCGSGGPCIDDGACAGQQICDLATGVCLATEPCGAQGACPPGELCRQPQGDCVPESRGPATIDVAPAHPDPAAAIVVDVSGTEGWANVGLSIDGPAGAIATTWREHENVGGVNHWRWDATAGPDGTHRATFVADPGGSTVYGIRYFQVGDVTPPDQPDAGAGGGGGASDGGVPASGSTEPEDDGGCGCWLARGSRRGDSSLLALVLLVAVRRRRRHPEPVTNHDPRLRSVDRGVD